jgi:hypothetical protein
MAGITVLRTFIVSRLDIGFDITTTGTPLAGQLHRVITGRNPKT